MLSRWSVFAPKYWKRRIDCLIRNRRWVLCQSHFVCRYYRTRTHLEVPYQKIQMARSFSTFSELNVTIFSPKRTAQLKHLSFSSIMLWPTDACRLSRALYRLWTSYTLEHYKCSIYRTLQSLQHVRWKSTELVNSTAFNF